MNEIDIHSRRGEHAPGRYYGKYAGVVTDNGPPPSGSHRGHVTVKVPGILEEVPDGADDRPLEVLAAPSFLPGFFFVPEVDARVWVEFVAGDINCPIWTGVWYPDDASPETIDAAAPTLDQKVIRTKSGHVIQLDDASGSERLVIRDETNDNTITLDSSGINIETKASGGKVTLTFGGSTVTVATDSVEIAHAGNKVTLKDDSVEIAGPKDTLKMDAMGTTLGGVPMLMKPLIDWLLAHQHVGNLGAPTPLLPAPPLLSLPPNTSSL